MRHVAVIGSGPAGYYTAEACQKVFGDQVRVDILDRMPVPFGLIRTGVAPDHQSIKGVSRRYEAVALTDNVRFVGNVTLGKDVSIDELRALYDAVVLATGAPHDRKLEIPGADLPGVTGSAAFVGWYNGHPDHADLAPPLDGPAVVIGNGNVALDVARVLAKAEDELEASDIVAHALDSLHYAKVHEITLLGRRGPHQIAMTPKELGELGELAHAVPVVDPADFPPVEEDAALDPGQRKAIGHLRRYAQGMPDKPIRIVFDFFAMPIAIEGDDKVERVIVERTALGPDGSAHGTGETYAIPASLVVSCIGYRTPPIEGVPYDDTSGRFANIDGRVLPGLYAVGWARRGPTGTIGTNRPDGFHIAEKIAEDIGEGTGKPGRPALDALLEERGVEAVTFRDWLKIDAAEIAAARIGSPREKFVSVDAMLGARKD
jgi:NADPH-dependent glutamate synthase beta subunit-like oxidoreductase